MSTFNRWNFTETKISAVREFSLKQAIFNQKCYFQSKQGNFVRHIWQNCRINQIISIIFILILHKFCIILAKEAILCQKSNWQQKTWTTENDLRWWNCFSRKLTENFTEISGRKLFWSYTILYEVCKYYLHQEATELQANSHFKPVTPHNLNLLCLKSTIWILFLEF